MGKRGLVGGLIKIAVVVIVVAAAGIFGLFGWISSVPTPDLQSLGEDIVKFISSPTRFFAGAAPQETKTDFSADIVTAGRFTIDSKDNVSSVSISYADPNTALRIGSLTLRGPSIEWTARDFKGRIVVSRNLLEELRGSASAVMIGDRELKDGEIPVSAANISFVAMKLAGVPKVSFELSNVTGNMSFDGGKGTYRFDGERFGLRSFEGTLEFVGGRLKLSGKAAIKTPKLAAPGFGY